MGFIVLKQPKRIRRRLANTASLRKAREEHREWLRALGLDRIRRRKKKSETLIFPKLEDRTGVPMGNKIPVMEKGIGNRREEMVYSGERKLVGIATMHKSNQVPVFADDDDRNGTKAATEIATMRRN